MSSVRNVSKWADAVVATAPNRRCTGLVVEHGYIRFHSHRVASTPMTIISSSRSSMMISSPASVNAPDRMVCRKRNSLAVWFSAGIPEAGSVCTLLLKVDSPRIVSVVPRSNTRRLMLAKNEDRVKVQGIIYCKKRLYIDKKIHRKRYTIEEGDLCRGVRAARYDPIWMCPSGGGDALTVSAVGERVFVCAHRPASCARVLQQTAWVPVW